MSMRTKISSTYLVVDAREGAVIPFLDDALDEHAHVVRQIVIGDYHICRAGAAGSQPGILACVERKSLVDFAQSICDGRYERERDNMLRLRASIGCQLFFFVEGPAFPSPSRKFSRVPYSTILSAMTHLMLRDKIFVIQTEDVANTAKRLSDLMRSFDSISRVVSSGKLAPALPAEMSPTETGAAACLELGPAGDEPLQAVAHGGALAIPDVLTKRVDALDSETAVAVWSRLEGVSVVQGKLLSREMSVAELAGGWIEDSSIRLLKGASGRAIGKAAIESLLAVKNGSEEHSIKLVSGIRNVTPALARLLLSAAGGLKALCAWPAARVALVTVQQKGRVVKLGAPRAERILKALKYKDGPVGGKAVGDIPGPCTATVRKETRDARIAPKPAAQKPAAQKPAAQKPAALKPAAHVQPAQVAPAVSPEKLPEKTDQPPPNTLKDEDIDALLDFT
jgi:Asfivirus ERCC4 domain-containing protein EP364R